MQHVGRRTPFLIVKEFLKNSKRLLNFARIAKEVENF